ncbi:MAG: DUF1326 domain-containing protein [Candidatus Jettenia caeni]|nr:DUF1326 domain-containing protein [Candidatus Jettenia sp. AMX1]NUN23701.1 DUF1326 domain-containing protein [Candidatus Jettenia caeni]WKZ16501.1 MAG: DUF1326 domain-containing protein [Candidatus Jettenia caeni]
MMRRLRYLLPGVISAILLCSISSTLWAGPSWSIEGEYFEGCTCNPGCPCLFGSEPTHNKTCKITGVFRVLKGNYGQHNLDGQTVIGITDLTATPEKNWIVFYINDKAASAIQKNALLDIFKNHVFRFGKVPPERITVRYLPIQVESSEWRKRAEVANRLSLDIELLHGQGDPGKPTQIVNKNFTLWAKEFDLTLDMGKAVNHRFHEDNQEWNYDGRSGFATKFHFTSD